MPFLYLAEQGVSLRKHGERFLVERDQEILLDVPYHRVENILLFGNIQITTQAVAEALDHGITVSFFTRNGRFRGSLTGSRGRNVDLRLAQYKLYSDPARSLTWAQATVASKIGNACAVLERYAGRGQEPELDPAWKDGFHRSLAGIGQTRTVAELDGVEGAAARSYFDGIMHFNKSPFPWLGRVKHPATDPLNALLSLGYTLLMNELNALLEGLGLDPALGFLHELDGNRPSLALDLMEPFRHPIVDRMVLTSVNRGMFGAEDFSELAEGGGKVLKPDSFRRYLEEYERWMLAPVSRAVKPGLQTETGKAVTFRRCVHKEIEHFASALRGSAAWAPFSFAAGESVGVGVGPQ